MSLEVKNSKQLLDPANFRWKVLIYGLAGVGKTEWAGTAPNPGFASCETGHGKGLLTVASKHIDYCEPNSLADFEALASGRIFQDKETVVLDSLSYMTKTFIKDYALTFSRNKGNSDKRSAGVPELDDYQVMAEVTRRLLAKMLELNKHVIVTATEKYTHPDPESGQTETLIMPDLPGALALTSTAMFDTVLRLRTRQKLRDPRDAKSRFVERYLVTQHDGQGTVSKSRAVVGGKYLIGAEEIFDLTTGSGSFAHLLSKIIAGYGASNEAKEVSKDKTPTQA